MGGQLEREPVLDAITELLEGVRTGRGGALFVVGEAGLGKTSCLAQAITLAAPAVRVGLGRADVMETSLPFGVVIAALGGVGCDLFLSPAAEGSAVTRALALRHRREGSVRVRRSGPRRRVHVR